MSVRFIFTDSNAGKLYSKLDKEFVKLLDKLLEKVEAEEIYINETWRKDSGYHGKGKAIDISAIYCKDKKYYFNSRFSTYTNKQDTEFLGIAKDVIGSSLVEYISPTEVYLPEKDYIKKNKYSGKTQAEKIKILDGLSKSAYELNANHLHHLHLAIDSTANIKTSTAGGIGLLITTIALVLALKSKGKEIENSNT
jgi:hypothetical protein